MTYTLPGQKSVCMKAFMTAYDIPERALRGASKRLKSKEVDDPQRFEMNPCKLSRWGDDHLHPFSHNEMEHILYKHIGTGNTNLLVTFLIIQH
jgi:hypothetical protein